MLDDIRPPEPLRRDKPKRIEPLAKLPAQPLHEQARAVDPSFQTPEETDAADVPSTEPTVVHHDPETPKRQFHVAWPLSRKQQILAGVLAVVVAFGIGAGWSLTHHKRTVVAEPKKTAAPAAKPKVIYSTLSGLPVADASVNQRTVTGVMIENSLDARPQSGLSDAGVVFEAVAEGGVTRFLALFQDTTPDNVGPIRSARPYYVSWDMGFDAAYAHVGGSDAALQDIKDWGTKDMNQFYNGASYHRISSREAPHNVYTGIGTLNQLEATKGFTSTFTGFSRKSDQPYVAPAASTAGKPTSPGDTRTPATSLSFSLSGPTYDPSFAYNPAANSYDRSEAGEPHMDANGNRRISPKVVIAIVVPLARGALDSSGAYYSDYTTIGSGTAYIFQDGTVTTGQWSKASNTAQISFTDAAGQNLALNRGQTWISAVSSPNAVSYK